MKLYQEDIDRKHNLLERFIIFAFLPYLVRDYFKVVSVLGWGKFIVSREQEGTIKVNYKWYKGLI